MIIPQVLLRVRHHGFRAGVRRDSSPLCCRIADRRGCQPPIRSGRVTARWEVSGCCTSNSATEDGKLVGYLSLIVAVLPRYGVPMVVSESFFVAREHRKSGAGLKLLEAAERQTRELGATVILVSAPLNGALARVLPRRGYVAGDQVFLKKVA